MVVDNSYNRDIKNKLKTIAYQKAAYARQLADNPASVPMDNQLDFMTVKHPELVNEWQPSEYLLRFRY